MKQIIVTSK